MGRERDDASSPHRTTVRSGDVSLAVQIRGVAGPTLLFMHGYPDTSAVWDPIVERLRATHRCVAYDLRGAGASGVPSDVDGYRIPHLLDDLVAVLDSVSAGPPAEPVHLVGHDWGSVVAWEAACRVGSDPRLAGRIASLTSISGPCLGHVGAFYRAARRASWRSAGDRRLKREAAAQALRSWYVWAFQARLADPVVRALAERALRRQRPTGRRLSPTLPADAVNGLSLYRANVRGYEQIPGGPRTEVPTLLVVPRRDRYVSAAMTSQARRFASDLTRVELDAGHWAMWSRPDQLAALIADFVAGRA